MGLGAGGWGWGLGRWSFGSNSGAELQLQFHSVSDCNDFGYFYAAVSIVTELIQLLSSSES